MSRRRRCWVISLAVVTVLLHADRLPYRPLPAAGLDHAGRVAKGGKREGDVLAEEGVGVVFTHLVSLYVV